MRCLFLNVHVQVNRKARPAKAHFWVLFHDGEYKCPKLVKDPSKRNKTGYARNWLVVKPISSKAVSAES